MLYFRTETLLGTIISIFCVFCSETIKYELANNKALVDRLLSDITYQSADNLVDGLTKANEEGYTYEHYYGNKKHQHYGPDHM